MKPTISANAKSLVVSPPKKNSANVVNKHVKTVYSERVSV